MKPYEIGLNEDEIEELFVFSLDDEIVVHHLKKGEESFLNKMTSREFIKEILVPDVIRSILLLKMSELIIWLKNILLSINVKKDSSRDWSRHLKTRNNDQNRDHTAFHR